jgi:hypothetical protein
VKNKIIVLMMALMIVGLAAGNEQHLNGKQLVDWQLQKQL